MSKRPGAPRKGATARPGRQAKMLKAHRLRAAAVTCAATAAAAGGITAAAPGAYAQMAAHCVTATSIAYLPAGQGYLFPNLSSSTAACGFVDTGGPYHFTVDTATSTVYNGWSGTTCTYTATNLSVVCRTVTLNGESFFATGCQPG
jgi:hypothetical protein